MRYYLLVILLCLTVMSLQAQTLNQAKTWFLQENYVKALPVFSKAVQQKPKDASINFWYGVCLQETGKPEASMSFLNFAASRKVQKADLYLALGYLKLGEQESSLTYFDNYLSNTNLEMEIRNKITRLRDSVQLHISLLQRVEDVIFLDSVILSKQELYGTLSLSKESGNLLPTMSFFPRMTSSYGHAYFPERNDRAFYADSLSGKGMELVARHRIPDGWDDPELFPDIINSDKDEINPFFLQDGVTLYFASNTPSSMGGFDIFVTRMNPSTKTYLVPDRLNMPYNSLANEYFLVIDEYSQRGYLATDRNTNNDSVCIYTFLPSSEKKIIKNKPLKTRQQFADIHSIRDTWEGKNMDSLQKSRPEVIVPDTLPHLAKDFDETFLFYINDSLNYSHLSDFHSDEARLMFQEYLLRLTKRAEYQRNLEDKRDRYQTVSASNKEILGLEILTLEKELYAIQKELPSLEVSARNIEIKTLSK